MTLRFGLALVGFLGACSLVSVGCGDDDPTDDSGSNKGGKGGSSAGEGGEGASGAAPGTGGRGGTSGTGGGGGTAGAGGRGGTGGAGGTAGAGGTDATGGLAGDAGGRPIGGEGGFGGVGGAGAGAGGAGNAGEAGAGGAPDMTADQCKYECVDDDDCARGIDTSYKCHPTRKRCENQDFVCDSHDDCIAVASGWSAACVDDLGCDVGFEVCINLGGSGRCAETPFPGVGCFAGSERMMPAFDSTGMVVVCGSDAGRCDNRGACFLGCSEVPCTMNRTCNATTGLCECTASAQCMLGVCNMTTHLCECETSNDCVLSGTNECVNGRCGCADASICSTTAFPNATPVCE